jgi:peptide/nickel transport system substrate-binding protein
MRRALGLFIVVLLAACGTPPTAVPTATSSITTGGTLRVAIEAETAGWVPTAPGGGLSTGFVQDAIYDTPVKRDKNGDPQPLLAESLTPDSAYKVWTMKLRSGVTYHDGTPLTAAAIKAIVGELQASATAKAQWAEIAQTEVVDDLTLKFTLAASNAWFPYRLTALRVFKPGLEAQWGKDYPAHPIGTGPFKLALWERDQQTVLERNPSYWRKDESGRQLPYLDKIIFRPITNADTRLASLRAGDLDSMMSSNAVILTRAEEQSGIRTTYMLNSSAYAWVFNNGTPPTNDPRVRLALAQATDRTALVAAAGGATKYQRQRTQFFAPDNPWYSPKVEEAMPKYDVAKAKATLATYINDPARNDKKPVGTPISLELLSRPNANQVAQVQVAQQQWGAIGVEVKLRTVDEVTFVSEANKGNFGVNWREWGEQAAYYQLLSWFRTNPFIFGINSPRISAQLDKLVSAQGAEAKAIIEEIGLAIASELPLLPLGQTVMGFASTSKVNGGPEVLSGNGTYTADWSRVWLGK